LSHLRQVSTTTVEPRCYPGSIKGVGMTEHERELDLMVGDLQRDNKRLRRQLQAAMDEAVQLRQTLEQIYVKALLEVSNKRVIEHDDKDSY
jgi:predicted RNase H-like nuclease (RuvC/YqgF family)